MCAVVPMWHWLPPFTWALDIELTSGLHDKRLYLLDHLDDPKTVFEGGIRKMRDWKFPIVLCPMTNKHQMPTKCLQTTCEWHRNLRDFQSGETGFCCREAHGKGLYTVYLIPSGQRLGYR